MKILLIMPDAHMHKFRFGSYVCSLREAPLTLTTLAALEDDQDIEWKLIDESVEQVSLGPWEVFPSHRLSFPRLQPQENDT